MAKIKKTIKKKVKPNSRLLSSSNLKSRSRSKTKIKFQQSWASIFIGAIVVVILGLLVANLLTKNTGEIDNGADRSDQTKNTTETIIQQGGKYKVADGDSLSAISMKYYNTFDYWPVLAKVNKIVNPNLIYKDIELDVPSKLDAEKAYGQMTLTSYDIKEGDSLFAISESVYGDGSKWRRIANANNVGYLPNGNPLIFAGNKLTIPR